MRRAVALPLALVVALSVAVAAPALAGARTSFPGLRGLVAKPKRFGFGAHGLAERIHWTRWGGATARGRGERSRLGALGRPLTLYCP